MALFAEAPNQCLQQALHDLKDGLRRLFLKTARYPKPQRKLLDGRFCFPRGLASERHWVPSDLGDSCA